MVEFCGIQLSRNRSPARMAHDVFISHSAKNKETADTVCAMLESNGIRCWIAPRDVTPGMEWGECIIEAIEQTRIMVLVFTAEANASPQIRREVERAVNRGVTILPLRVEDVAPGKALEYFIGNVHWLDALTPPLESHLARLAVTIQKLLSRMEPRDEPPLLPAPGAPRKSQLAEATPSAKATKPVAQSKWVRVVLGAAVVLIVLGTVWLFFGKKNNKQLPVASTVGSAGDAAATGAILVSDDGKHWTARNTGTPDVLEAIFASSDGKRFWIVAKNGAILESLDGKTWLSRTSGTPNNLYAIFGTSDGRRLWAVGNLGTILESDDGEHWNRLDSGTPYTLLDVYGTSDGTRLWVVGDYGTILESTDGEHWVAGNSGTQNNLHSIFGTADGKRFWIVGDKGTILESTDGEHWTHLNSGTANILYSIFGTSDGKRLWAVGDNGTIVESDDGEPWTVCSSGSTNILQSIFAANDGKQVWVVGRNATILKSDDGIHWYPLDSGSSISFFSLIGTNNGKHLWVAGH
jgi:photosystem II stability/assembly factor-like uncharacterized protein